MNWRALMDTGDMFLDVFLDCPEYMDERDVVRYGLRAEVEYRMHETCDRCGPMVRAAYRVTGTGDLYLCLPCTSRAWRVLTAQGWVIWPADVLAVAPQAQAG